MNLSNNFIKHFDNLSTDDQHIVYENIIKHMVNWKNAELFERINGYIVTSIIEFKQEISEQNIDITENLSTERMDGINRMLDKELKMFDYYFNVEKCDYLCKIIFEVRFPKFEYSYSYHGCKEGDGNSSFTTLFYHDHNLTQTECDVLKLIFCDDSVREACYNWMHVYHVIGY